MQPSGGSHLLAVSAGPTTFVMAIEDKNSAQKMKICPFKRPPFFSLTFDTTTLC